MIPGLPGDVNRFWKKSSVYAQYMRVTDRQPDGQTDRPNDSNSGTFTM